MSLFSYPIGRETPIKAVLSSTATATLLTAGNNGGTVIGLRVAEAASAAGQTATLQVLDTSLAAIVAAYAKAFTAREVWEPVRLDSIPIVLLPGEKLQLTPTSSSALHVTGVLIEPPQK